MTTTRNQELTRAKRALARAHKLSRTMRSAPFSELLEIASAYARANAEYANAMHAANRAK